MGRAGLIAVDTSALVAILQNEAAAPDLAKCLAAAGARAISAANYVELGAVLGGRRLINPDEALADLDFLLVEAAIDISPVTEQQARTALAARIRFGRGFGGGAGLNLGDCFAYALAKTMDCPLLYVGNDFAKTDIVAAL